MPAGPALLLEDGSVLLLENGLDYILLGLPFPSDGGPVWRYSRERIFRTLALDAGQLRRSWSSYEFRILLLDSGAVRRSWSSPESRIWRGDPMAEDSGEGLLTMRMSKLESKTFGFDFTEEGAIRDGETIVADPAPEVFTSIVGGVTIGIPEPIAANFHDSDGSVIKAGKGVKVRITGSAGLAVGVYDIVCRATTSGGDKLQSGGKFEVKETIGT